MPIQIGGYADHIHILCLLSKKVTLVKLLEEIKSHSSKWMKTQDELLSNFYWQDGYGAFSVNPSEADKVITYIVKQHEYHRKITFQGEYRAFLKNTRLSTTNDMFGIDRSKIILGYYALSGLCQL